MSVWKLEQRVLDYFEETIRESLADTFKPRYFPGTWNIISKEFRNSKKDEDVEKFIN